MESYWQQTPRTLHLAIGGAIKRLTHEREARAWLAWWTGVLSRDLRERPTLEDFLGRDKPDAPAVRPAADIHNRIRAWGVAAQMAGAA